MSKWAMIRVSNATKAKLEAMKARFDSSEAAPSQLAYSEQDRFGYSLGAIIDWLILQEENHRERSKNRKAKSATAQEVCQSNIDRE